MRLTRRWVLALLIVLASAWVVLGLGYSRMSKACYDSRHMHDREPEVFGGPAGVAIDVVLWPLFQATAAAGDFDCKPRPVLRGNHGSP